MNSVITRAMFVPMLNIMTSSPKWQLKSQNFEDIIYEEIKLYYKSFHSLVFFSLHLSQSSYTANCINSPERIPAVHCPPAATEAPQKEALAADAAGAQKNGTPGCEPLQSSSLPDLDCDSGITTSDWG